MVFMFVIFTSLDKVMSDRSNFVLARSYSSSNIWLLQHCAGQKSISCVQPSYVELVSQ